MFYDTYLFPHIEYLHTLYHLYYVIMAVLKWTKPQALPLDGTNGICWLTATVIPLTKHDTVSDTYIVGRTWSVCDEAQPDRVMISAKDFVISWGWGQCQGWVHRKCVFLSCLIYVIDVLYGYRSICLLWKSTHRGYYHLIIQQGCCQVFFHII